MRMSIDRAATIERVFRSYMDFKDSIKSVKRLEKGHSTECWRIDIPDDQFLMKIAVRKPDFELHENILEASNLVSRAKIRTPKVRLLARDEEIGNVPFLIQEFIPGRDAEDILEDCADSRAVGDFFALFGKTTGKLHSIRGQAFGDILQRDPVSNWPILLDRILEKRKRANLECGILRREQVDYYCGILSRRIQELPSDQLMPAMTHRDLHLGNILVSDSDEELALLDFEHVRFHDPLEDFVKLNLWVFSDYPKYRKDFMRGYSEHTELPDDADRWIEVYSAFEYLAGIPYFSRYEKEVVPQYLASLDDVIKTICSSGDFVNSG